MTAVEIPERLVSLIEQIINIGCFGFDDVDDFVMYAVRETIQSLLDAGCNKSVNFETGNIIDNIPKVIDK